jgi:hypothetical protein
MREARMPGTLLFVHGTGVRGTAYQKTVAMITARAVEYGLPRVTGVPWGDNDGSPARIARSMPNYATTGGGSGQPMEADLEEARWAVLYTLPWFELDIAASIADRVAGSTSADLLYRQLKDFVPTPELTTGLDRLG